MNPPRYESKSLYLVAFLVHLVVGCASQERPAVAPGGFELRGKLGVTEPQESFSARFLWRQQGSDFSIDLWGPFGQGRVRLMGNAREMTLLDGDGSVITRGEHEAVMRSNLGWSLPLGVLPDWVQGRPASDLPVQLQTHDDTGRLTAFRQLDWQVELDRFREAGDQRPARLLPYRVTAQRGAYRVRLAISEWRI